LLSQRYGNAFSLIPEEKRGPGSKLMLSFERAKKTFDGDLDMPFRFEVPSLARLIKQEGVPVVGFDMSDSEVVLTGYSIPVPVT